MEHLPFRSHLVPSLLVLLGLAAPGSTRGDGILVPPIPPEAGRPPPTLWESRQEAIIIAGLDAARGKAVEDLVLKISVRSLEEVRTFTWVIPFPNPPEASIEDPEVFEEVHRYLREHGMEDDGGETPGTVEEKSRRGAPRGGARGAPAEQPAGPGDPKLRVISRKAAGGYDVSIVQALEKGALEVWLEREGYRPAGGGDVFEFYREKGYVFACLKVTGVELAQGKTVELQPIRFRFETGGRDGVYFPMKMTGIQAEPFDLELHLFTPKPVDEDASRYGYAHRGLRRLAREGNADAAPLPLLAGLLRRAPHDGRHHLTTIGIRGMQPGALDAWPDDLWVFPRYADPDFVPLDARPGGPAAGGWPEGPARRGAPERSGSDAPRRRDLEAKKYD